MKKAADERLQQIKKYYGNNPTMNNYLDQMRSKYGVYFTGPMNDNEFPVSSIPYTTPGLKFVISHTESEELTIDARNQTQWQREYHFFFELNGNQRARFRIINVITTVTDPQLIIRVKGQPYAGSHSQQVTDPVTDVSEGGPTGLFCIGTNLDRVGKNYYSNEAGPLNNEVQTDIILSGSIGDVIGLHSHDGNVDIVGEETTVTFKPTDTLNEGYGISFIASPLSMYKVKLEYEPI